MSNEDSDSESSDSSNEFMVSPEKLKSISPFFVKAKPKNVPASAAIESTDESDLDDNIETPVEGSDLMVQVLKNLEATKQAENLAKEFNDDKKCGKISSPKKELTNEIADLLLMGETGATASTSAGNNDDEPDNETPEIPAPSDYTIPKEGVKITLVNSSLVFNQRKKKKQETLEDLLKKKLNQQLRSNQVLIHKVGLLCWLARGFYINKQINNPILLAAALKLAPKNCYPKGRVDLSYLEKITKWFHGVFALVTGKPEQAITTLNLLKRLKNKEVYNYWERVLLYIATLRALGLNCRLVISLQPPSLKVARDQLIDTEPSKENKNTATGKMQPKKEAEDVKEGKNLKKKIVNQAKSSVKQEKSPIKEEKSPIKEELPEKSNISTRLRRATEARKRAVEILKRKRDGNVSSDDEKPAVKKLALRSGKKIAEPAVIKKEKGPAVEKKGEGEAGKKVSRTLRSGTKTVEKKKLKEEDDKDEEFVVDEEEEEEEEDDEDEDFEKKTPKSKRKEVISKPFSRTRNKKMGSKTGAEIKKPAKATARRSSSARKLVSSDEESEEDEEKPKKVKQGKDIWAEVYVESEENWISVSVNDGKIHCTADLYVSIIRLIQRQLILDKMMQFCLNTYRKMLPIQSSMLWPGILRET